MEKEATSILPPPQGSVSYKDTIFSKLNPEIIKAIEKFKLREPTDIQKLAIDPILQGKNALLISETGTGKTLAAVLPLLHMILKENPKPIAMLYITPLRSLNRDMIEHLVHWGNELNLEISVRHGDTSAYERRMQTEFPPHILITTPETIQAILPGKKIREHLKNVRYVVIDECLPYDTTITLADGSEVKIGEIVESNLTEGTYEAKVDKNICVKTLDKKLGKIVNSKILKVHKIPLSKNMIYIRTKYYSQELSMTSNHPILVVRGKKLDWINAENLQKSDKILIANPLEIEQKDEIERKNSLIVDEQTFKETYLKLFGTNMKSQSGKLQKIIQKLRKRGILPLYVDSPRLPMITRLMGNVFGDGWLTITEKTVATGFSGFSTDLEIIKRDLLQLGFSSGMVNTRNTKSSAFNIKHGKHEIKGISNQIANGSNTLAALLVALGTPHGKKTNTTYDIPNWIFNAPLKIKKEFVAAYLGSEMSLSQGGKRHLDFDVPRISIYKRKDLLESGLRFASEMEKLLIDFDVKISDISFREGNVRKDGSETICIVSTISNNEDNLINLFGKIGVKYCNEKENTSSLILQYLLAKRFARLNKQRLIEKIKILKRKGFADNEIGKILGFDEQLNSKGVPFGRRQSDKVRRLLLFKKKQLRGFLEFETWKKYLLEDCLIDEISVIKNDNFKPDFVYDLTIDDTHNFLANNIVVHNCHELVDSKRGVQLSLALERIKALADHDFQVVGLSATVGMPEHVAKFISANKPIEILKAKQEKPIEIQVISPKGEVGDRKLAHQLFTSPETAARLRTIQEMIENHRSILAFTNTREFAEVLSSRLKNLDRKIPVGVHHSSLSKEVRIKTEKEFKEEKIKAIIATSSLQLGIDIGSIDLVLQYMSPRTVTQLVQRCLPYDSKVLLADGKFMEIGKLVEEKINPKIISYESQKGFVESKIVATHKFFDDKLIRIKLECGEDIICTQDHPVLTRKGWNIGKNITKDDRIAELCYELNLGKEKEVLDILDKNGLYVHGVNDRFTEIIDKHLTKNKVTLKTFAKSLNLNEKSLSNYRRKKGIKKSIPYNVFIKTLAACGIDENSLHDMIQEVKSHDGNILRIPKTLNEEFMWLAGIVATEGSIVSYDNGAHYRLKIGNKSKEIIDSLIEILKSLGIRPYISKKENGFTNLEISNHTLIEILNKLGTPSGKKSEIVDISDIVFTLKNNLIYAFIKGVLDGDGSFVTRKNGYHLRLLSSSEKFIYKLHLLLSRLGYYTNILKYPKKTSKIVKHTKGYLFCLSITKNKLIKKFFDNYPRLGKTYKIDKLSDDFRSLRNKSLDKFVRWLKIKEISIENKIVTVYNLTLNGEPNFLVGNIITHNCGRSGHALQKVSKGIVIATDEDDVFEASVIARKALHEELEDLDFHEAAYDVLAHQIVGLTLDYWRIDINRAYEIVRKAYPYQKLTMAEFMEVCKQLSQLGLVFLNGEIKKKYRGFDFYYHQLSTIPDTKQFRVFNTIDNTFVGVLDEEFVALHGENDTTFVIKGQPWRIIQTEEDRVMVEPVEDIEAAIPGWEGELIPVPYAVAQEVGKLRAEIKNRLQKDEKAIVEDIQKKYPVDANSARKMISLVRKQKKFGLVPDDKTWLVEEEDNIVVIHTCAGTLVNETLGRFLTSLLTARMGSVGLRTDPYRIILTFAQSNVDFLKEILFSTNPEFLQTYLEAGLIHSTLFEWKFVHVAKRFGAISRGAEYGKVRLGRIIDSYAGTPLFKETLKELETEKLDIEKAVETLKKLQKKEIKLIFSKNISPLGKLGIKHKFAEVVGPQKPEAEIFNLFRERLYNTQVRMICFNCGKWERNFIVEEIPKDLRCGSCFAKLLAVVHPKAIQTEKIIKKKLRGGELTVDENARYERARKTADLFIVYGKKSAVALAARGVGPVTARRILAKFHKTDDDFLRDLLEAERNFIKTRKYWST